MRLAALTSEFYVQRAASFSATRDHPWPGWKTCLPYIENLIHAEGPAYPPSQSSHRVLDLACGNLRFFDYLHERFPAVSWTYHGIDNAEAMVPAGGQIQTLDIMSALFRGDLASQLPTAPVDLSVCFAFLHHVPLQDLRRQVVQTLVNQGRPGGLVIFTAWQFARDPVRKAKAEATTSRAAERLALTGLSEGDYLLGWQNNDDALRYCHSLSDPEIDDIISAVASQAQPISRFRADGKTNTLNTYVILQVN
jgi:SAM-dependent methyltransferase